MPEALPRLLADKNTEAASRVMQTMMGMQKIEIGQLDAVLEEKKHELCRRFCRRGTNR
ncbi:hypothetical protein [Paraglaciecola sp.]|uniref:hypothetical protein n=1 Tax=Paraglaciecola sp. TaxID=1920173 RepID=UPI0030F3ED0F